jgi:hypothetical protein
MPAFRWLWLTAFVGLQALWLVGRSRGLRAARVGRRRWAWVLQAAFSSSFGLLRCGSGFHGGLFGLLTLFLLASQILDFLADFLARVAHLVLNGFELLVQVPQRIGLGLQATVHALNLFDQGLAFGFKLFGGFFGHALRVFDHVVQAAFEFALHFLGFLLLFDHGVELSLIHI